MIGRRRRGARRWLDEIRAGRMQRTLALTAALSAPPLAFETYLEHYKASFGDRWMWTPVALAPALTAAGVAAFVSPRAAKTWLPAASLLYGADGLIGVLTHLRGLKRRPGGFAEAKYNLVMGPPLLAPGSLCLVGALGLLAAVVERER
jgi:hypothetical protein